MDFIFSFYLFLIIILPRASSSNCRITQDDDSCVYTVICMGHAGSAPVPICSKEPHVTFNMTGMVVDTITAGFFGSTNFDSRVRVINAYNNSWTTIEDNTFKYYTKTYRLDISNNKIQNINNEAFKNLIYLENLNLSNNYISKLNPRVFFNSAGRFLDILNIDLSHNEINEISKTTFSFVPKLLSLNLSFNFITSITDDSFCDLENLITLKLQGNRIRNLGIMLLHLKSLEVLDLSLNQIYHLNGYEINRLTALKSANFSYNFIELVHPDCFKNSVNLEQLDLSYNYMKTNIDNKTFTNCSKLYYLDYAGNSICKIEDSAFKGTSIRYFNFGSNNLTMDITAKTFLGFQNITEMNFYNQSITGLKNESFSKLINLVSLNISRNFIKVVESQSFRNATSLMRLDLSFNFINDLEFLCCLTNLTEIVLNNNKIENISKNDFKYQLSLKKLDISFNKIISIEPNSLPLKNLQFLILNGNYNITNAISKNMFNGAKVLRNLDLSYLKFTKVESQSLVDLPGIAKLNLSHSCIELVDPDNFINMDNMYSLDISYNLIRHIEIQANLNTLKALYLNNNKIANISKILLNASNLIYLELSHNNISDLSNAVFETMPNLIVLYLSNNKITTFTNAHTNVLKKLLDLRLGSNLLSEISLKYYSNLVSVDLKNNNLTNINITFFENLDSLQSLDISLNSIQELQPGTFQNVKILKLLNLSSNFLQTLRFGSLRGLHRTELLDLSNNNLSRLDIDVFHECTELRRLIIDNNKIKTIDIDKLVVNVPNLKTLSLGGNPISCNEIIRNVKYANKTLTRLEVTALDKIYHEDNVYGIKCGDFSEVTTHKSINEDSKPESTLPSSFIILVWCLLFVIVMFGIAFGVYLYKNGEFHKNNDSPLFQYRQSLELNRSDYQSDLLS